MKATEQNRDEIAASRANELAAAAMTATLSRRHGELDAEPVEFLTDAVVNQLYENGTNRERLLRALEALGDLEVML